MLLIGDEGEEASRQKALSEGDITLQNADEVYSEGSVSGGADSESDDSQDVRVPRAVMVAFREAHGISLRVALNKKRYTKGTNPI